MFCFHKWKVHSVQKTKSTIEKMREQGYSLTEGGYPTMFEKKQVVVMKCSRCGMIKEKMFNEDAKID